MTSNAAVIAEFRANGGRVGGPWEGTPLLLLHHIGARTGIERVTPLGYFARGEGRWVIVASKGGSMTHPDCYFNVKAHPKVTIEVGAQRVAAVAHEVRGAARAELWPTLVAEAPQLGGFQASITRVIPVLVLVLTRHA